MLQGDSPEKYVFVSGYFFPVWQEKSKMFLQYIGTNNIFIYFIPSYVYLRKLFPSEKIPLKL